jgi:hypothetical protein
MNYRKGIPFPVHAEILDTRATKKTVNYITEVPTEAIGYMLLLEHLHLYPVCLEKVLVTYTLPNTKDNSSPNLRVILTTHTENVPIDVSYLWWLDPTCAPLHDYQQFLSMLKAHSEFPTVPVIKAGAPISTWLEPRKQLQKAIKQHRAFLRMASDYPSITVEDRADFLAEVDLIKGSLDEWPT